MNALLCLGVHLFPGQDRDMACVCRRALAAGGIHALVCHALWHRAVARHNQGSKALEPWRICGASYGARGLGAGSAGTGP